MNAQVQPMITPPMDDPQRRAIMFAQALALSESFRDWLPQNWPIWFEFVRLADKIRIRGREHYSARAVLHVLRWERALRDTTEPELKINNNRSAEMARLYNGMVGFDFFRTREHDE